MVLKGFSGVGVWVFWRATGIERWAGHLVRLVLGRGWAGVGEEPLSPKSGRPTRGPKTAPRPAPRSRRPPPHLAESHERGAVPNGRHLVAHGQGHGEADGRALGGEKLGPAGVGGGGWGWVWVWGAGPFGVDPASAPPQPSSPPSQPPSRPASPPLTSRPPPRPPPHLEMTESIHAPPRFSAGREKGST